MDYLQAVTLKYTKEPGIFCKKIVILALLILFYFLFRPLTLNLEFAINDLI